MCTALKRVQSSYYTETEMARRPNLVRLQCSSPMFFAVTLTDSAPQTTSGRTATKVPPACEAPCSTRRQGTRRSIWAWMATTRGRCAHPETLFQRRPPSFPITFPNRPASPCGDLCCARRCQRWSNWALQTATSRRAEERNMVRKKRGSPSGWPPPTRPTVLDRALHDNACGTSGPMRKPAAL